MNKHNLMLLLFLSALATHNTYTSVSYISDLIKPDETTILKITDLAGQLFGKTVEKTVEVGTEKGLEVALTKATDEENIGLLMDLNNWKKGFSFIKKSTSIIIDFAEKHPYQFGAFNAFTIFSIGMGIKAYKIWKVKQDSKHLKEARNSSIKSLQITGVNLTYTVNKNHLEKSEEIDKLQNDINDVKVVTEETITSTKEKINEINDENYKFKFTIEELNNLNNYLPLLIKYEICTTKEFQAYTPEQKQEAVNALQKKQEATGTTFTDLNQKILKCLNKK